MRTPVVSVCVPCVLILFFVSCEREARPFENAVASASSQRPLDTDFHAGGPVAPSGRTSPFQENAWGISEGKRLFEQYNCSGCHSHGGGGMGPALMDDKWIYGSRPGNIFETIVEGRPNGMPAWRGKITDTQIWQIVAYVQSMNGQAPLASLPSRSDHLRYSTPENARPAETPVQTGSR